MTEFRGLSSGVTITTKNKMNNVMVGNKIKVEDNAGNKIAGIVVDVVHRVYKWENHQGLERSTHNIVIDIDDK